MCSLFRVCGKCVYQDIFKEAALYSLYSCESQMTRLLYNCLQRFVIRLYSDGAAVDVLIKMFNKTNDDSDELLFYLRVGLFPRL